MASSKAGGSFLEPPSTEWTLVADEWLRDMEEMLEICEMSDAVDLRRESTSRFPLYWVDGLREGSAGDI